MTKKKSLLRWVVFWGDEILPGYRDFKKTIKRSALLKTTVFLKSVCGYIGRFSHNGGLANDEKTKGSGLSTALLSQYPKLLVDLERRRLCAAKVASAVEAVGLGSATPVYRMQMWSEIWRAGGHRGNFSVLA